MLKLGSVVPSYCSLSSSSSPTPQFVLQSSQPLPFLSLLHRRLSNKLKNWNIFVYLITLFPRITTSSMLILYTSRQVNNEEDPQWQGQGKKRNKAGTSSSTSKSCCYYLSRRKHQDYIHEEEDATFVKKEKWVTPVKVQFSRPIKSHVRTNEVPCHKCKSRRCSR